MQAIKNIVTRVTSVKGQPSLILSILIVVLVSAIPAITGIAISDQKQEEELVAISTTEDNQRTSKEAEIIDASENAVKTLVVVGNEIAQEVRAEKLRKKTEFENNKSERWVYMIGDWVDKGNDESLLSIYKRIGNKNNVCCFRKDDALRFFINESHLKNDLEANFAQFQSEVDNTPVSIVDLNSFCDYKSPIIKLDGREKLGRKKEKRFVDCYKAGK